MHAEVFEQIQVPSVQSLGFTSKQDMGEDNGFVQFELCGLLDVVLV